MKADKDKRIIVEFQPSGLRLVLDEPMTLLDAARQAGILLRSDCGGKGVCGKCRIQLLSALEKHSPSRVESFHLQPNEIASGVRLACETIADSDLKVFIPSYSIIESQVLQIEGIQGKIAVNPAVHQYTISIQPPSLSDLRSDMTRIKQYLGEEELTADIDVLAVIPTILRSCNWNLDLILRDKKVIHARPKAHRKIVGLAVDVGSTKLACYLVDLESGETLTARGAPNPQLAFGEDIMNRLSYALQSPQNAGHLQSLVFDAINHSSKILTTQVGLDQADIADACLVGNTAMHHLFLNLPVTSLAASPFVPIFADSIYPPASSIGMQAMPGCSVYAPPIIAGFVGSDHLAFLLAEGFGEDGRVRIGIDIGTNTEIALQKGERIVSVSTASGPAFEGAHIRFGMRAAPGAIEHVNLNENGEAEIQVIGNRLPVGICGSGILDVIAEMRRIGMLNNRGRIEKKFPSVMLDENGKPFIQLNEGKKPITLSQNDIDQVLLAKGAIRAGIDVLMDYLKVIPEGIEDITIAGAFGTFMSPEHAICIGMLPKVSLEKVRAVGNAAGSGARMMLISSSARKKAESLSKRIEYLELTIYPDFANFFAKGIQA